MSATVAILVAATFIPLGYVAWSAVSVGWTRAYELVVRPRVGELLVNTVALVVVTVPLCVVARRRRWPGWWSAPTCPGRAFWRPLFVAPLAVPAFVNSYAWVGVIPSLHGLWAGVLVTTLSYFPFMYVPVAATLRRLDPAIEESARALGSDSAGVFFRVVLPQLRLAILGGGLLIGVHLLAEYGAFAMVRFDTFTAAIFQQFQVTFDGAAGSMLAGVLVLLCLVAARRRGGGARQRAVRPASARARHARRPRSAWAQRRFPRSVALAGAGGAGARRAGVDDPALAVDRRHRGVGARRNRHRARPDDRRWPPRPRC